MDTTPLTIEKSITIKTSREKIYHAITDPAQITKYFPYDTTFSENKVGGEFRLSGSIEGNRFTDHGKIEILEPPRLFQYSYWGDNHGTERTAENHLTIAYTLTDTSEGTKLDIKHSNIKSLQYYELMNPVWNQFLLHFKNQIETER